MAPQIIQSMEILQLPTLELQEKLAKELLENPVLEMKEAQGKEVTPEAAGATEAPPETAELAEVFDKLVDTAADYGGRPGPVRAIYSGRDKKYEAMQNTAAKTISLQEYLMDQLAVMDITEREREICEYIVNNIDDSGYLLYSVEDLARSLEAGQAAPEKKLAAAAMPDRLEINDILPDGETAAPIADEPPAAGLHESHIPITTPETAEQLVSDPAVKEAGDALKIVQALDPPGVGARSLQECLLLQLKVGGVECPLEERLVREHLDDIMQNRIPKVVRETGLDIETVRNVIGFIVALHPKPGIVFGGEVRPYVIPDVVVEMIDGKYEVRIEEAGMPRLRLSKAYRRMLTESSGDNETKEFIKKKLESARWLMQAIEMRRTTLLRISNKIVEKQREFLDHGVKSLAPLRMQTVAEETGLHVSTVSRAITDKYMQTPQGIFEMRFFFTGGTEVADGSMTTNESIKQKLLALVEAEDKTNPVSDDQIVEKLKSQGIELSRRTVTKYRRSLSIPPSRQRRRF